MLHYILAFVNLYIRKKKNKEDSGEAVKTVKPAMYLHTKVTALIFIFAAMVASTKSYFGRSIDCAGGGSSFSQLTVTSFCLNENNIYTYNTYGLPDDGLFYPLFKNLGIAQGFHHVETTERQYHSYLRYTGLVLFLVGILYIMPYCLWNNYADRTIEYLVQKMDDSQLKEEEKENIYRFSVTALLSVPNAEKYLRRYQICLISNVFVNSFHILGCMYLFPNVRIVWYAFEYVAYLLKIVNVDTSLTLFPRQAICEFSTFGPSGTVQNHNAICFLTINAYLDKFMLFVSFWLLFVGILNFISLQTHCYWSIHKYFNPNSPIRPGQLFLLSLMKLNLKKTAYNKILAEYKQRLRPIEV